MKSPVGILFRVCFLLLFLLQGCTTTPSQTSSPYFKSSGELALPAYSSLSDFCTKGLRQRQQSGWGWAYSCAWIEAGRSGGEAFGRARLEPLVEVGPQTVFPADDLIEKMGVDKKGIELLQKSVNLRPRGKSSKRRTVAYSLSGKKVDSAPARFEFRASEQAKILESLVSFQQKKSDSGGDSRSNLRFFANHVGGFSYYFGFDPAKNRALWVVSNEAQNLTSFGDWAMGWKTFEGVPSPELRFDVMGSRGWTADVSTLKGRFEFASAEKKVQFEVLEVLGRTLVFWSDSGRQEVARLVPDLSSGSPRWWMIGLDQGNLEVAFEEESAKVETVPPMQFKRMTKNQLEHFPAMEESL